MYRLFLIICFFSSFQFTYSQGCSDAGVCTLGGMKSGQNDMEKFSIALNTQYGLGEQGVGILSPQLELFAKTGTLSGIQLKLPYIFTNGNLGTNSSFGDITLGYTQRSEEKNDKIFGFNIGLKFATGSTNALYTKSALPISLPMPYQTGLGTNDLLLGGNMIYKKNWLFALGVQVPLIQNNKNSFDTSLIGNDMDARQYFSSSQLIRRPDLVVRIDRKIKLNDQLHANLGFIPIYHLGNDESQIGNNKKMVIENSDGLTLNFASSLSYKFSETFETHLRFATPLMVRKVRPDGLTRSMVLGLELKYLIH
jgi:hypothetical protein